MPILSPRKQRIPEPIDLPWPNCACRLSSIPNVEGQVDIRTFPLSERLGTWSNSVFVLRCPVQAMLAIIWMLCIDARLPYRFSTKTHCWQ